MNDILNTASFDQFTDFKTVDEIINSKSRIIFSSEAYKHFLELINNSKNSQKETGCYFLGREQGKDSNQIFIDKVSPDFASSNGNFLGGAVDDTRESQTFRKNEVRESGYDCLFHFHVHTAPINSYYDIFSDQDLKNYVNLSASPWFQYYSKREIEEILERNISDYEYEKILQSFFRGEGHVNEAFTKIVPQHRKVTYFGMLATPDRTNSRMQERTKHNNYQISTIFPELQYDRNGKLQCQFYRFPNMYYIGAENKIYKIGDFKRRIKPELSNRRTVNNNDVKIQAIGRNPNTGRAIEDVEVGKYIDGQFVFNREFSPNDISNLTNQTITKNPGILSRCVRKVKKVIDNIFNRDNDRNI